MNIQIKLSSDYDIIWHHYKKKNAYGEIVKNCKSSRENYYNLIEQKANDFNNPIAI